MNETPNSPDDQSLQRAKRFDALCDEFESECSAGNRPSIESFLLRVDGTDKQPLLVEFIAIEMHYRRQRGESIALAEYQTRFPGLSALRLEEAIQHSEHANFPKTPAADDVTIDSQQVSSERRDNKLVKYFGDYELLDVIARGGMGIVYKARQVSLNRIVALKMILSGELASKEEVERFYSEGKAAALLDHPGIVPIYEIGEHEGKHFFSMTYVEGSSLASKLNEGPLEPMQAASTMLEVSRAVHYAHEQGVIHRDLKPSNILLDLQGRSRVTDFGLAKRLSEDTGMTVSGQVLGTPSYMPPEQAAGQINTIGPASDVYGLGAVLYSLTTGRPPFQSASKIDTLRQVVEKEPVTPRQLNPAIPQDLETIILKCLEKSLPRRYGTAKLLSEELQRFVEGRPIVARPIGRIAKIWRWCRRQPMVASLLTCVFVLLGTLAISFSVAYLRELAIGTKLKVSLEQEKQAKDNAVKATDVANKATEVANQATAQAELARSEKERQAEIAEKEKEKAKASEANTRRNLYVSDVSRVEELVKEPNLNRAKLLLERHIPKSPDEEDLRSFDWYYHWRQVSQQKAKFDFKKPLEVIALSADDSTLALGCEGGRAYLLDLKSGKVQDTTFSIDEEHWSSISFIDSNRLIGHGQQGSFKLWDQSTSVALATKPSWYAREYRKQGKTFEDRIPATVSKDGFRMVCSDIVNNLAIWDLRSLRPRSIPFINEGNHSFKVQGQAISELFALNPASQFSASVFQMNEKMLTDTGSTSWGDFLLRKFADKAAQEYAIAGTVRQSYVAGGTDTIGHPITAASFSADGTFLLTGNKLGEIQLWNTGALESPSRWTEALPRSLSHGKLPIRSVSLSPNNRRLAICDGKQCCVYGMSELNPFLKIDAKDTSLTIARFIGIDLVAVGSSGGWVDIWRVSDSKKIERFFAGQGEIREILSESDGKSLYTASSDGSLVRFEMEQDPLPMVPQPTDQFSDVSASVAWLPHSKRIAFHRVDSEELVLVDPSLPEQPTALDLKVPGVFRKMVQRPETSVLFFERKNGRELASVHSQEINVWNRESNALIKRLDAFQHVDGSGRIHPITSNQHPFKGLHFKGGAFTELPKLPAGPGGWVVFADLFSDERRLAMVLDGGHLLQLMVRDLDTGEILSELRILGANAKSGSTVLSCLDDKRVFVDAVTFVGDTTLRDGGLIWNTSDDSLTVVDNSLQSSVFKPTGVFGGSNRHMMNQARDRKEIGIWDGSSIRILDSNSLTQVVKASPPKTSLVLFAHLASNGELHAVIGNPLHFCWAKWNRDSEEWQTIFDQKRNRFFADGAADLRWSFDATQSVLYHMQSPGIIQRWSTEGGFELPALRIPSGSVESFQLDESGMGVALLNSKLSDYQTSWSATWYNHRTPLRSFVIYGSRSPFVLSLPATGWWLTDQGVYPRANAGTPAPVHFEGKELEKGKPDSHVLCSRNHTCLVQIVSGILHHWRLDDSSDGRSTDVYRYLGSSVVAPAAAVVKSSLTPRGSKIAIVVGTELRWSAQPFKQWDTIQLNVPSDAMSSSIQWSWDEKTVAVGFTNGDVLLNDVESGSHRMLARGHQGAIRDLFWHPDRRSIATAGSDGDIVFWDLSQLEIRMRLRAHKGAVNTLAYDSANNTLYSGGEDGLIRSWVAASDHSIEPKLPSGFMAPDPNSPIQEAIAAPSRSLLQNREVVEWLKSLNVDYKLASFGMPLGESSRDDQLDAISVHTISLRDLHQVVDDDLSKLSGLTELRSLDLSNCKLSVAGLRNLERLDGLHTLNLSGIDLTGFDFDLLKDSANLRMLSLERCSISDDQLLAIIRLFPKLQTLEVSKSSLTDISVSKIDSLKNLTILTLASSNITDESLLAIQTLKLLEKLDISNTKITGENLLPLGSIKLLNEMRIKGAPVTDDWIKNLVEWQHLKFLDVRDSAVTSEGVKAFMARRKGVSVYVSSRLFGELPQVETLLQLGPIRGQVNVDGKPLAALKAIEALNSGGSITGLSWPIDKDRSIEDLELLAKLPKLERISVSTDAIPKTHFPVLPRIQGLRELELNRPPYYTENDFSPVGEIAALQRLKLEFLYDKNVLVQLQKLTNLESLEYGSGVGIDDLARALPQLRRLVCPKIESKALTKAIPFLQSLETLTMLESPEKGIGLILANLTNLKQLNIRSYISATELKKLRADLPGVKVEETK